MKTAKDVIQKAINDRGEIGLGDFQYLYGSADNYIMDNNTVTFGQVLRSARQMMIDIKIPIKDAQNLLKLV